MIKVLAIDDEPLALQQLELYIKKIPFFELAGLCQSTMEADKIMENESIDAMFCDINMPDMNGHALGAATPRPPFRGIHYCLQRLCH
jgi:DNA-binding LytR/AlgR family response regulator